MFENIDKNKNTPKKQTVENGIIKVQRAGRPKAPNMQPVTIRLDKNFHREVKIYAKKIGIGKSALVTAALKSFMEIGTKKYRLTEID